MSKRYFSQIPVGAGKVTLTGPEAHHLIHVLRANPGDVVALFDGSGAEFVARVEHVGRSQAELAIVSRQEVDRELPIDLVLGASLPKGDRQRWLVEKAVELGVRRLVPLVTSRSVAQPAPEALRRLRRIVIEASKQCGRNRLMEVDEPENWNDYLASPVGYAWRLIAHPATGFSVPWQLSFRPGGLDPGAAVFLAIGPEGGLTPEEVHRATAAGWQTVNLGPRILRVETAAILLVAMVVQGVMAK